MANFTEVLPDFSNIDELPDDVLLEIFKNLSFPDIWNCARVCQRWYPLARSLPQEKIVVSRHLKKQQLSILVQHHLSSHLEVFELLKDSCSLLTHVKKSILVNFQTKCPKIKKMVLTRCSLVSVTLDDMPKTLRHLSIRGSEIHPYKFFKMSNDRPQLTCLDVAEISNCLTSENLHILLPLKSLCCLYLENCFRINNGGIESIIDLLPQLQILDVEGTDILNEAFETIMTYCPFLKELYVGHTEINDAIIDNSDNFSEIKRLSILCLRNTRVTMANVFALTVAVGSQCKILSSFPLDATGVQDLVRDCNHYKSHSCTEISNCH